MRQTGFDKGVPSPGSDNLYSWVGQKPTGSQYWHVQPCQTLRTKVQCQGMSPRPLECSNYNRGFSLFGRTREAPLTNRAVPCPTERGHGLCILQNVGCSQPRCHGSFMKVSSGITPLCDTTACHAGQSCSLAFRYAVKQGVNCVCRYLAQVSSKHCWLNLPAEKLPERPWTLLSWT